MPQAALEAEWRRREKDRETEHAALRQEYTSMQSRTQQVLTTPLQRGCGALIQWSRAELRSSKKDFNVLCLLVTSNCTCSPSNACPFLRGNASCFCMLQVLAAAEEREKKVAAAEEGVARRRKELEREHAARLAEAEATVRRLQVRSQALSSAGRISCKRALLHEWAALHVRGGGEFHSLALAASADWELNESAQVGTAGEPRGVEEALSLRWEGLAYM